MFMLYDCKFDMHYFDLKIFVFCNILTCMVETFAARNVVRFSALTLTNYLVWLAVFVMLPIHFQLELFQHAVL